MKVRQNANSSQFIVEQLHNEGVSIRVKVTFAPKDMDIPMTERLETAKIKARAALERLLEELG